MGTETADAIKGWARPQITVTQDSVEESSARVETMLPRAIARGRLLEWQQTGSVATSMVACWVWLASPLGPDGWAAVGSGVGVGVFWGLGVLLGSSIGGERFGDPTPLRQIRLGADVVSLLALLPFSLILFRRIVADWRRPVVQWVVATSALGGRCNGVAIRTAWLGGSRRSESLCGCCCY
jgi:hypothetical protein